MRAFILIAISLVLFFCDYWFHCFSAWRSRLSSVTTPIQYVINWPQKLLRTFSFDFISKRDLFAENTRLQKELQLINAKLQRLGFLEYENSQLHALLNLSELTKNKLLGAQVFIATADGFNQQITVDKGKQEAVYVGQPVLDAYGLFGQVIEVGNEVSTVMLLTNNKSAIPAMVIRNGLQTVAVGTGQSDLELLNVPETADIREGDFLVTSGLGQRFSAGYRIGVVKKIKRDVGERFVKVFVTPSAQTDKSLYVFLIWPDLSEKTKLARDLKTKKI